MAKKRNLEGNSTNHNMFSALSNTELADLSTNLGACIDNADFATFDLLKELECARKELYSKQLETNNAPQSETVGGIVREGSPLPSDWIQEENSDPEEFILVLSKKRDRERRNSLKLASQVKKKTQVQETPDHITVKDGKPNPPVIKKDPIKRKKDDTRSFLEL